METFEQLAIADVATFLYEQLKMYDNLETTFSNIDLKLASLEEKARQREQIIEELKSSYVSASNRNQPVMLTIN
jgi:chaperonin cofactor prefoldin